MDWPGFWDSPRPQDRLVRTLLLPLSHLYAVGWRGYLGWYELGLRKRYRPPIPVIGIGGLTVGGAGKTPAAVAVAQILQDQGFRVAVSCSGYGGTTDFEMLPPGRPADASALGDEAAFLRAKLPSATLIVGRNRVRAAKEAAKSGAADVLVLDDGFQHLPLARNLDLVVLDSERPFGNRRCLPAGPLREPPSGLRRADALLIWGSIRSDGLPSIPRFHLERTPMRLRASGSGEVRDPSWLQGAEVVALSAIGNPAGFENTLRTLGAKVLPKRFPDHHRFRSEELASLAGRLVVTTEKDAVKLCTLPISSETWVLEEGVCLRELGEFLQFLLTSIAPQEQRNRG